MTGWKNAWYAVLLLAGLAALVAVPALLALPLPGEGKPLSGERVDIGFGATIAPPSGARLDLDASRPGTGAVSLRAGEVRLRLTAQQFRGDVGPYVAHARHKLDRDEWLRPVGGPERVATTSGVSGERGSLRSDDSAGVDPACYAIFTARSVGVVVLATPAKDCTELPASVWAAVTSIEIDPAAAQ
ncbi:hypothetical protein OG792_06010 [Micromonospora sp. NBC_01699]|uniref:hypothetical protein n=1 Tax=Micromonospora sp. NBC_01699 TaxID=2975984 RepID=UPI002E33E74A|nr:hypothetical protein [Micromonospora sp. NBC_01699]